MPVEDNIEKSKNHLLWPARNPCWECGRFNVQDASDDGGGLVKGRITGEDSARCIPPPPPLLRPRISPQSGERPGGATTIESIIRWHDESWPDLSSDLTTRLELRSQTWSLLHDDSTDSFACWCRCCSQLSPRQGTFYSFLGLFFWRYSIHRYTMDIRGFQKLDLAFSQIWNHLLNDKISCSCSLPPDWQVHKLGRCDSYLWKHYPLTHWLTGVTARRYYR